MFGQLAFRLEAFDIALSAVSRGANEREIVVHEIHVKVELPPILEDKLIFTGITSNSPEPCLIAVPGTALVRTRPNSHVRKGLNGLC